MAFQVRNPNGHIVICLEMILPISFLHPNPPLTIDILKFCNAQPTISW